MREITIEEIMDLAHGINIDSIKDDAEYKKIRANYEISDDNGRTMFMIDLVKLILKHDIALISAHHLKEGV